MTSEKIQRIFISVDEKVQSLIKPDRFYIALYDPRRNRVEFPWIVENRTDKLVWESRQPDERQLPDYVLMKGSSLHHERDVAARIKTAQLMYWPGGETPASWLGVPITFEGKILGGMFTESQTSGAFDQRAVSLLSTIASQTATAIERVRLDERLERQIKSLSVINEVTRGLSSDIEDVESEVLQLVYKQASQLMHTENMYIALYDKDSEIVRFPLMFIDGIAKEVPSRKAGSGRTEYIINTKKPLFIETRDASIAWYKQIGREEYIDEPFASWVGVPMINRDRVIGVIASYHKEDDYIYTYDDLEILSLLATEAAIVIDNAQLVKKERQLQEQKLWATIGQTAGSLAHRIGNKGGIIRVIITDLFDDLKAIGVEDGPIFDKIKMIERNNQYLLEMSDLLFKPVDASRQDLKRAEINLLVADALHSIDIPSDVDIQVEENIHNLPQVSVNRSFVEVFVEIINNALVAMKASIVKKIIINGQVVNNFVEISFQDTGPGISEDDQETLFDLFDRLPDSSENMGKHRGFGLWWVKSFLSSVGGDLLCKSVMGEGTNFIVQIPL